MQTEEFQGAKCGCCGQVFTAEQRDDAIRHAGMICGPQLRLLDEIGGAPSLCPHGERDWLGNPR